MLRAPAGRAAACEGARMCARAHLNGDTFTLDGGWQQVELPQAGFP